MGIYDTYGHVQLKVDEGLRMEQYNIGDDVPIMDGIYRGDTDEGYGYVVVYNRKLVMVVNNIKDTFGRDIKKNTENAYIKAYIDKTCSKLKEFDCELNMNPIIPVIQGILERLDVIEKKLEIN